MGLKVLNDGCILSVVQRSSAPSVARAHINVCMLNKILDDIEVAGS